MISWASLFAFNLEAPIYRARTMLTMRASYLAYLFLDLNSNFSGWSISKFLGSSNLIPTLLPFTFEALLADTVHSGGASSSTSELNSTKQFASVWDLRLYLEKY